MKKETTLGILQVLAYIFIISIGFMIGKGYQHQKDEKIINQLSNDVNSMLAPEDFFVDSSYQYLEGHRLDLPDEISEVSWYDDKEIDLMAVYIDDGGDIHLGFTGKTIPRSQFVGNKEDSLNLIEEHSELTTLVRR